MGFYSFYPPSGGSSTNPSVGTNGQTAPTSSTEVAGVGPDGNLHPLSTDNTGKLNVNISSGITNPLPVTDAAAEASLASIDSKTPSLGQKTMAASQPVTIASDQSAVPISASALPLPTGASTAALQTAGNTSLASIDTKTPALVSGSVPVHVDNFPATQPVSGTVAVSSLPSIPAGANAIGSVSVSNFPATQPVSGSVAVTNFPATQPISATALPLPTGASTAALQSNVQSAPGTPQTVALTIQGNASGVAVPVSGSVTTSPSGTAFANAPVQNVYSSTNVTTAAYVQLIASTSNAANRVDIFDSSGQAMILAVGGVGSEVIQYYVPPGGDAFSLKIPAGSRVAIKALTANATAGYILLNLLQ